MARRKTLERDGEPVHLVYPEFAEYAGGLPLVSFNLEYDLDEVLKSEWQRLGISAFGRRGFCTLRLAQRLLDPVPAGNCKQQTLRQYYRLPERGAHTALGDVQTVADLMAQVLRPIAGASRSGQVGKAGRVCGGRMVSVPYRFRETQGSVDSRGPRGRGLAQLAGLAGQVCQRPQRDDTFSGNANRFTNQPHREWIYRQAYELGRHIIGYEAQKVWAAVDFFEKENSASQTPVKIGVGVTHKAG